MIPPSPCPNCQRVHRGPCDQAQARLLPPPPLWKRELQQRVEAYRARQAAAGWTKSEGPANEARESDAPENRDEGRHPGAEVPARVVSMRPVENQTAEAPAARLRGGAPRRLQALAEAEEPLAEPAVTAPRPRPVQEGPTLRVIPPPPRAAWREPALPESAWASADLAESVRTEAAPRERRRLPVSEGPTSGAAFLQIPLPMVATPEADSAAPAVRPAPRELRMRAGLTDAGIVLGGVAVFALAGWASQGFPVADAHSLRVFLTALPPVAFMLAALYLGFCSFAGGVTVGMRRCGLRLAGLDGALTESARRRRSWASLMSLAALGLGYAWAYCDPNQLTWHDYISRSCVTLGSEMAERT